MLSVWGQPEYEDQDWDWYFLMRHHDAPTRLLNWSDGAAQRSRFVVFGEDPFWLEKEYEEQDFIKLIEIDPDPENISKMRIELRECGVTGSVIFPDLDGLGREKQVWEDRK